MILEANAHEPTAPLVGHARPDLPQALASPSVSPVDFSGLPFAVKQPLALA